MYVAIVLLFMLLLPAACMGLGHFAFKSALPLIALAGKWFVFWAAGIRLLTAGLRQVIQPRFTATEIFKIQSEDVLPMVRELGNSNLAVGVAGSFSLYRPSFRLPVALIAGIFYGIAGFRHALGKHKSRHESLAMVSDLFAFLIFTMYVGFTALA